jgi:hypothetical protein
MTPQEKKFAIILAIITATCSTGLFMWGSKGDTRYEEAKASFDEATNEINRYNKFDVAPTQDNLDKKEQAVISYDKQSKKLIQALRTYGATPVANTDAQAFTDKLVKEVSETKAAFKDVTLPEGFFLGFEKYANTPAQQSATGILSFQLDATSELVRAMAEAKPTAILNVFREPQPEESGKEYKAGQNDIFRALPMELSFRSSEKTLRSFLDAMQSSKQHFYVIRSMRITNVKQTPPVASEARFETADADEEKDAGGAFGAFELPPGDGEAAAPAADAAPAPEPVKQVAVEEILKEVLGSENINVFMRIDVLRYNQEEQGAKPKKK